MDENKPVEERREHHRFKVRTGAYAAFVPYSSRRGQIINISEGGLAFQYIAGKKRPSVGDLIAILFSDIGICLKDISFKIVSDFEMDKINFFSIIKMRRCGGKFGSLTHAQAANLEYFIRNYTLST